jgi:hypothetical protein
VVETTSATSSASIERSRRSSLRLTVAPPDGTRIGWSFQTAARAKPARPEMTSQATS